MPRPPRIAIPNATYHVTARGNRGHAIFVDNRDRFRFLELLANVTRNRGWMVHAFCLMTNHYHVVLETPQANLSGGMQSLNSQYAQWFNRHHEVDGHLFKGRFYAALVMSDSHLLELSRYLALNPVRAGLCMSPTDWPWSSYRSLIGNASSASFVDCDRVLRYFASDTGRAREIVREFVEGLDRDEGLVAV